MRVRLGDIVMDVDTRLVHRGDEVVHLTPKAYQLLVLLVEAEPRALSKDELQQGLWPTTFVDEANLSVVVAELRAALGDDARQPRYVRTVHGFGYAVATPVTREFHREPRGPTGGAWWLHTDVAHFELRDGDNVVGRELPVEIWLDSASVSRRHARIGVDGERVWLDDLQSKNGTWVGERRVTGRLDLADGDEVRFGSVVARLRWTATAASTETMAPHRG